MIKGLNHIAISTPDLDRATEFYCSKLGFHLVKRMEYERNGKARPHLQADDAAVRAAVVKAGAAYLEIVEYSYPVPNPINPNRQVVDHGLAHICLEVDDLDHEYARLQDTGVTFHSPPIHHGSTKFVYGRDMDGNVMELIEIGNPEDFPAAQTDAG